MALGRAVPILLATLGAVLAIWMASMSVGAAAAVPQKAELRWFKNTKSILVPAPGFDRGPAEPYPSRIKVRGFAGSVRDVQLILKGLDHNYPDDVDVVLVHDGINRMVMSDVGGGHDIAGVNLIVWDGAGASMPDEDPLSSSAWLPTDSDTSSSGSDSFPAPGPEAPSLSTDLSGFDGTRANGSWKLYAYDDSGNDVTGSFARGWMLGIKAPRGR